MIDEAEANPVSEPVATPVEQEAGSEAEAVVDNQEELDIEGIEDLDNPDIPRLVDVEIDGKTFKVPEEIKDGYLKEADYRTKTMALAEERKGVEAVKAELERRSAFSEAHINAAAQLRQLDGQMAEYQNVDWQTWEQQDPGAAANAKFNYLALQQRRNGIAGDVSAIEGELTASQEREIANLVEGAVKEAGKIIPNWSDEYRGKLEAFAVEQGIPAEAAKAIPDAAQWKILHLARLGAQFETQRAKADQLRKAQGASPVPELGRKAQAGNPDPASMSMEEYAKWRGIK